MSETMPTNQQQMRIGIIIGSVREGRKGEAVARWVKDRADEHRGAAEAGLRFEVVDLKTFELPVLTSPTVPGSANRNYDSPQVTRWSQTIDDLDGFIFVTPEYNHSVPGAFKNAFDSIAPEWTLKPVAFVSYGADSGVRAVEHWRTIVSNFQMVDVRQQVSMSTFNEFGPDGFRPDQRRSRSMTTLLDQLTHLVTRLRG
ncbi:NADPH-dependent FMN reductase [Aestuariimicrobium kwangyangense]|uniref:NADPH-dependent FMN reductase n=1 Tax=Aestuariimicrobium kwangyangense TaxID=396389 RepID=UPI0003B77322|nr:NAD(P)H-dependent oxidoreductase [Aestuariimicrobium kwangyangense]